MTDLFATIRKTVLAAVNAAVPGLPEDVIARVEVSPTRPSHGDMATNAAMVCAKAANLPPVKLATAIVEALRGGPHIAEATTSGPGFVNLRLDPAVFRAVVPAVLIAGESYGDSATGQAKRVNVASVSADLAGPTHVGHCRGAVVADALANLLAKVGFDVTRQCHINDAQGTTLAGAAYRRYSRAIGSAVPGRSRHRGGDLDRSLRKPGDSDGDFVDKAGRDAIRFAMLMHQASARVEFDLDHALAMTRENPFFRVQYAHARCRSALRWSAKTMPAEDLTPEALARADLSSLTDEVDTAMIRRLATWPRTVEAAAAAREPHRIAFFLCDLADDFNMLWNRNRDDAILRFLQTSRPAETRARLALVAATAVIIRSGLRVLGVEPVEEMR
jgi:arginyl-tRNA synthetase